MPLNAAESNRTQILLIPEAAWSVTPGSGTVYTVRLTSSSIVPSKDTVSSDEIRADRMVSNLVEVAASTSGSIEGELSAGTYDLLFQQALLGAWTKSMNHFLVKGIVLSVSGANEITITGTDYTDYLVDGQYLKLEGMVDPENNVYVSINGAPSFSGGNTVITVDQTLVVEAGSAFTKLFDASDVVLANTLITFNSTGNVVDGGGANAFGSLVIGQKLYIEGLSKETGSLQANATDPGEGDTFTIADGVNTVIFEIRTDATLVSTGNVHVALSGTPGTLAASIGAAVNAQHAIGNTECSATVATDTATIVNNLGTGGTISSASAGLTVVNFSGGVAANQGFVTVASLIDSDSFATVEALTTNSNSGGATVVVKGSHLRNPGVVADITKQSVTVETGFTDVAKYLVHRGLRVGGFSLQAEAGSIASLSFEFMGTETTTSTTSVLGDTGTYTVLGTTVTEVMNATSNVGTVKKDGVALATSLMSIELTGDNSLREQRAVGSKFPAGIGYGRFTLEGKINAYFQDFTLYDAFINHETVALEFDVADVDQNTIIFRLPSVKFSADPLSPQGIDEDIMEEMDFTAFRDGTYGTMFMMDRFSSVKPFSAA